MVWIQNGGEIMTRSFLSLTTAALVALFIAVLSGLGVGSGGLFVIWLTAAYGVSSTQARGMNLLFFVFSASAALLFHYLMGRIDLKFVFKLSLFAVMGTLIGTFVGKYLSPALLRRLFGIFLIISGAYSFISQLNKKKRVQSENASAPSQIKDRENTKS